LPNLHLFVIEIGMIMVAGNLEAKTMSAQFRPIGTMAFVSAFLISGFCASVPANIAFAADCLTAPNSPAPPNSRWYYRTDRLQQRKCWHLQSDNGPSEQGAAQSAGAAPAKASQSVVAAGPYAGAGFKGFVAQQGGAKPSDQDVEKLYAEFLEWKRRTKN
jgi:hypothetical protein